MLRATLKSLWAHKLRLALTALSVVLGVAFVTGTLVLTDTISSTFDDLVAETTAGVDVSVNREQPFGSPNVGGPTGATERPLLDSDDIAAIASAEGVAAVEPEITGYAQLLDRAGKPIGGNGPPTLGYAAPVNPEVSSATPREGEFPSAAGTVAIDAATAERHEFGLDDQVTVLLPEGPPLKAEVVGILGFGEDGEFDNLAGATLVMFDVDTAAELYSPDETYGVAYVVAEEGVSREAVRDSIAGVLGKGYEVQTGEELLDSQSADIDQALGFFTTAMLVFAAVSLLVAAFIITNTFSIIVAQRTRELALLRAIGASRGQVLRSVLTEAVATGIFGSAAGLVVGLAVATGLRALMAGFGIDLPDGDLVFAPRTVVAAIIVGVGVTTVAALAPALKANRVPPVAALQGAAAPPAGEGRIRIVVGAVVLVAGVAALVAGLFRSGSGIQLVGLGAGVTLIGAALLSPIVTRPLVALIGAPVRRLGVQGHLARENALRNPRRTAATASALMIGLGLVSFVLILGASINSSATASIDRVFRSEFRIQTQQQAPPGLLSADLADAVAEVEGVQAVTPLQFTQFQYDDKTLLVFGVRAETLDDTFALDVLQGDLATLADGGLVVTEEIAANEGWSVGDVVPMRFAPTGIVDVQLRAVISGSGLDFDFLIDERTFADNATTERPSSIFVKLADGVSIADARPGLEQVLTDHPTAELLDVEEQKASVQDQVNQLLGLMTGLLALSVIIALFGIVNTLGLSVFERMRELGLLRAVGMERRQLRWMIRWEAVLIALLGATFGLGIGILFGWLLVTALADQGITTLSIPVGRLAGAVVIAALAGVLAAIGPGRRAARVDVLRALEMT